MVLIFIPINPTSHRKQMFDRPFPFPGIETRRIKPGEVVEDPLLGRSYDSLVDRDADKGRRYARGYPGDLEIVFINYSARVILCNERIIPNDKNTEDEGVGLNLLKTCGDPGRIQSLGSGSGYWPWIRLTEAEIRRGRTTAADVIKTTPGNPGSERAHQHYRDNPLCHGSQAILYEQRGRQEVKSERHPAGFAESLFRENAPRLSKHPSASLQVDKPMSPVTACAKKQSITLPVNSDDRHHRLCNRHDHHRHRRILHAKTFPVEVWPHSRPLTDP
jgi:hypothetical protein